MSAAPGFNVESVRTPKGREVRVLRLFKGDAEAEAGSLAVIEDVAHGESFNYPLMIVSSEGRQKGVTDRVKQRAKELQNDFARRTAPLTIVAPAMVSRLAIKALMVVAPHQGPVKVTATEAEALAWMDGVLP